MRERWGFPSRSRLNTGQSGGASQPVFGFVFQGLIAEGDAGGLAAAAADAFFRVNVNGTFLVRNGAHGANVHGVAILAVVRADDVQHSFLLFSAQSEMLQ